jgi:uncharacterized membrane protein
MLTLDQAAMARALGTAAVIMSVMAALAVVITDASTLLDKRSDRSEEARAEQTCLAIQLPTTAV